MGRSRTRQDGLATPPNAADSQQKSDVATTET